MKINVGSGSPDAMVFSPNGEYVLSGGEGGVQVWRLQDGKRIAKLVTGDVRCLAVSNDGKWIAAGTYYGHVLVWDANTYKQVFAHNEHCLIHEVNFSPDSTRLVSALHTNTVTIRDIGTRERVQILRHDDEVIAAEYSPQGDRIATATRHCVRVYDSNDVRLLVAIKVEVTSWYNTCLLWSNDHLVVASDGKIKQFEASTGSVVSEWPVHEAAQFQFTGIALPKHGEFIAHSAGHTVTFWNMATRISLFLTEHPQEIRSIALSPNDRLLALGGKDGEITIKSLSWFAVRIVSLWIVVHVNNSLAPTMCSHRVWSLCLVYNPRSRNRASESTTPRSMLGSTINSRAQKHH